MAPSQMQISTSALQRLLKEEQSYYKEQEQQEARISKLKNDTSGDDENHDYQLKQEVRMQILPLLFNLAVMQILFKTRLTLIASSKGHWKRPRPWFLGCAIGS